jgi:hypothetical protein
METKFQGSVTRNSNGSIEITSDSGALGKIEMGSRVDVSIEVVESAADIEEKRAEKRKAKEPAKASVTPQSRSTRERE